MKKELRELEKKVKECTKCELWKNRKKAVFGEGPENADIFLIGLGPGKKENLSGKPFVGRAGKFLNELLKKAGLKRENVYITSVLKCYLPKNKATKKQIKECTPYLEKQLELIKPKTILPLGNVAIGVVGELFDLSLNRIGRVHGKEFKGIADWCNVRVVPMYHPAAALRNGGLRETLEKDWKKFGESLA